jgi:hypothetical protein
LTISSFDQALRIARLTMSALSCDPETAVQQLVLSEDLRARVLEALEDERLIHITDPYMILGRERRHVEWLPHVDRATWLHWPRLRDFFIGQRGLPEATVRSIDDVTDRILGAMEDPRATQAFKIKGLVLGYVQSGKTTNYSALMAKGADVGFKLFIVLSGIHDGLRLQTQRRLHAELVAPVGVAPLTGGHPWQSFTAVRMKGDFDPGTVDPTALTAPNPVLLVVKKNVSVLRRLLEWLDRLPAAVRQQLPVLIIDDEADQATPNTGGNRVPADDPEAGADELGDEAEPSRINECVRTLVNHRFTRVAYVAYTATPFANVFIDHTAVDREAGDDLYPRDFIIDLPMPHGYFGAERIFGRADDDTGDELDIIRLVPDEDVSSLIPARRDPAFAPRLTQSLRQAFDDFVLAGAAMAHRGRGGQPASMLIHTSYLTDVQQQLTTQITEQLVDQVKDDWRYRRGRGVETRLRARWDDDFRRVTRSVDAAIDVTFDAIRDEVATFLEQVQVRRLNSRSEDELDYDRDKDLKVVVIGGNRLSRGLTLENLLVSYYVRPAMQYDTLMQMGRWFGYREGYYDLTRIHTTAQLAQWFSDLATVEVEVREEVARYDRQRLTPLDFAVRVRKHPALLPTSRLKMKATDTLLLSFDEKLVQTINFRFGDRQWLRRNLETTRAFLTGLGPPVHEGAPYQPQWRDVPTRVILEFLDVYQMDPSANRVRVDLLRRYIRAQATRGELTRWTVAVAGRSWLDARLGTVDLEVQGHGPVNAIERTRIKGQQTLKAIVSADDEAIGIGADRLRAARGQAGADFRALRPASEGLLLIYPISRRSGHDVRLAGTREPIFPDPEQGEDVIGVALSFPHSQSDATIEYLVGTVGEGPPA